MKPCYLYIIMSIFSLLALPGCRDEEAVQISEGTRTVTVNLGIAMSRVTKGSSVGDGSTPKDMKVWIFNQDNTELVDYYEIENPTFSGSDALGELVNTHERIFELDNSITELNFYVVLNSVSGTGINLSKSSSVNDIQNATFTALNEVEGDNQVPIYGEAKLEDVSVQKKSYSVTIETTRAVSKLEMFFTKSSESAYLKINNIKLEQIPDKGYINDELIPTDINYNEAVENILSTAIEISKSLSEDITLGNFSTYEETNFDKLTLNTPYLLENVNGGAWSGTESDTNQDYIYPYDPADQSGAIDETTRYKMTVSYQTTNGGDEKEQVVHLPAMRRNEWNKIFARVKGGALYLSCTVQDWEDGGSIDISYAGTYDGELTPISTARVSEPENDPAYAVVYGGGVDISALSFTFKITQPVGATWTANLTNGNQFVLEGNASGTVVGEEDNEFTFIVRPNQEFSVDDIRETELYITVTTINGEHPEDQIENGEQIINPDNTYPGTQTRIKIRQVSSEEWNGLQ